MCQANQVTVRFADSRDEQSLMVRFTGAVLSKERAAWLAHRKQEQEKLDIAVAARPGLGRSGARNIKWQRTVFILGEGVLLCCDFIDQS